MTDKDPQRLPEIGNLIVPKHKPETFHTVLEVETILETDGAFRAFRVYYLRIKDNKKIQTVWYNSPSLFWKYYDEC